jgi:sugar/nucleoside kinase (ribokinase family)
LTARRTKRVLVVGSVTRDTNIFDGVAEHTYGGTALYAARTYAEFGIDVRLVTRLAPADRAPIAAQLPRAQLIAQPSAVTTTFENSYGPADERTQRVAAIAAPIDHRADYFVDVDWLHLGPLHPADLANAWLTQHAGKPVGLDLQGFARRIADEGVIAAVDSRIGDLLPRLQWLKASRNEWQPLLAYLHLSRTSRPTRGAIESLVTDGAAGGDLLRGEAHDTHWVAAPPVEHCDPTGAGDVFFAAYLVHRAGHGTEPALAAKNAARITSAFLLKRRGRSG